VEKPRPANIHASIEAMTELLAKKRYIKRSGGNQRYCLQISCIDDIRNAIAPIQKECALNIIPKIKARHEKERTT